MTPERIPIAFVTGFLGSGKTTLIRHILSQDGFDGVLVIVNEFGEVGIDHDLLEASSDDTILLANGCLCCTIRGNLVDTLNDVIGQREQNRIRPFDRVVVETSGVADPAYLSAFLFGDAAITGKFRLSQVIATCDAVAGPAILERFPEARGQARIADRLLITKGDLSDAAGVERLERELRAINPTAPISTIAHGALDTDLFTQSVEDEFFRDLKPNEPPSDHSKRFAATVLTAVRPLTDPEIERLVAAVAAYAGAHLLRLKGVIARAGRADCVLIQASLMVVHPPEYLSADAVRRPTCGRLVLITENASVAPLMIALAPLGLSPLYLGPGWTP